MKKKQRKTERKLRLGYQINKCPICKTKTFEYAYYYDDIMIVEQHGYCSRCGFVIEQTYYPVYTCFWDVKKGYRHPDGSYYEKNKTKIRCIKYRN